MKIVCVSLCVLVPFLVFSVTAHPQTPPANAGTDLGGASWQRVNFRGGDDATLSPDDKTRYTIAFASDGGVSVRGDCNRGRGTWKSAGPSQLQFGPLVLTRAMCPPVPLNDRIPEDWQNIARTCSRKVTSFFPSWQTEALTSWSLLVKRAR